MQQYLSKVENLYLSDNVLTNITDVVFNKDISSTFIHLSGDTNIGSLSLSGQLEFSQESPGIAIGNNNLFAKCSLAVGNSNTAGTGSFKVFFIDKKTNRIYIHKNVNLDTISADLNGYLVCNNNFSQPDIGHSISCGIDAQFLANTPLSAGEKYIEFDVLPDLIVTGQYVDISTFIDPNTGENLYKRIGGMTYFDSINKKVYINSNGLSAISYDQILDVSTDAYYFNFPSAPTLGDGLRINASYSCTIGQNNAATGDFSFSSGKNNKSYGKYSFTNGSGCQANYDSHAEGRSCVADGYDCHAEGMHTYANSIDSIGNAVKTSYAASHAEGVSTSAIAAVSHAEGIRSCAQHNYSFVWNGNVKQYTSNPKTISAYESNGIGSFNINPYNGLSGFYVGTNNMAEIINNIIFSSCNDLSAKLQNKIDQLNDSIKMYDSMYNGSIIQLIDNKKYISYADELSGSVSFALLSSYLGTDQKNDLVEINKLADNLSSIEIYAFASCDNLTCVNLNNIQSMYPGRYSPNYTGYAFRACQNLKEVYMSSLTSMNQGYGTFINCKNLQYVDIRNLSVLNKESFVSISSANPAIINIANVAKINSETIKRSLLVLDFRDRSRDDIPAIHISAITPIAPFEKPVSCYVPNSLYDSWIAEPNWAQLSSNGYVIIMPFQQQQ